MKIRVGYGLGVNSLTNDEARYGPFVDALERLNYDSLWVSERIAGQSADPVVSMAYAAGRTKKLKFGMSVMVLSGRNPVLVAKSMASLDRLSGGRLLPAFGLGAPNLAEWQAFGIDRKERAPWFDEALPLMRRLWAEDKVTHHGARFSFEGLSVLPKPANGHHLDVWLGGQAPSELRRVGRLADGWLPSFTTPEEVRKGIDTIKGVAAEHGREVPEDHYGVLVAYRKGPLTDAYIAASRARRPELDPNEVIPDGLDALRRRFEQFTEVGASKFVAIPVNEPEDWAAELEEVAERVVVPLQN